METSREKALRRLEAGNRTATVLDFDHTLFLDNSTERFLDSLRPQCLAYLLVMASDFLLRVAVWFGWRRYDVERDYWRIRTCLFCMPWGLRRWAHGAESLAAAAANAPLLSAIAPGHRLIILSFGFEPIIRPLLAAMGISGTLIASRFGPDAVNLRRIGKRAALAATIPESEWAELSYVTDSEDDADLLAVLPDAYCVAWRNPGVPAFTGLYHPLRYTLAGKYPHSRYFTHQIVLEDYAVLLLAYAFSWPYAGALAALFFSLYCVYELGYYENDQVAAQKEERPVVSAESRAFSAPPPLAPWIWAGGAGVVGLLLAHRGSGLPFEASLQRLPADFLLWMTLPAATYLVFRCFNRLPPKRRVWLFPLLHCAKTCVFLPFVPITGPGAALLGAQVVSLSANYTVYRNTGDNSGFNRHAFRLVLLPAFLGIGLLFHALAPTNLLTPRVGLMLVWAGVRAVERACRRNILLLVLDMIRWRGLRK